MTEDEQIFFINQAISNSLPSGQSNTPSSISSPTRNEWSDWLTTNGVLQRNVTPDIQRMMPRPTESYKQLQLEQEAQDLQKYFNHVQLIKEQPESFNFFKALTLTK